MKKHNRLTVEKAKQFFYAKKWISDDQIHHKLSTPSREHNKPLMHKLHKC
jgi:hypothetical protein